MSKSIFHWPVRVYYSDTDAGGVVYHANYLNFFEHARTEMLRAAGYEQHHGSEQSWMFVVGSLTIDFQIPARLNQQLTVETEIIEARGARIEFLQRLVDDQQQQYCQAKVQVACIDNHSFRPVRIPLAIKKELTRAH